MSTYFLVGAAALVVSLMVTPLIIRLAWRLQIIDRPAGRKMHQKPTPLLGGLAIYGSFTAIVVIISWLGILTDSIISTQQIGALLLAGGIIMVGGYCDDRYSLKPLQQICFPLLAIGLVILSGIKIANVTNPNGGILHFSPAIGIGLAAVWLLGMTYTTKILDGLDGLVVGVSMIGSIIIFIVSLYWDHPSSSTSILAVIFAGALLGFLPFNWHPAKIFLGEAGSVWCGFMLGVLGIISGSKIATTLLVIGIPILDLALVILRRLLQGSSPAVADRQHLHLRLFDSGLSHRQTVMLLYGLSAIFGIASLFLRTRGKLIALLVLAVCASLAIRTAAIAIHKPTTR